MLLDVMLLEWLDNLSVDEPQVTDNGMVAGWMSLEPEGAGILRHAVCYELTANGKTLIVDRETGTVEIE